MATPRRVADINPGFAGSFPADLTAVDDTLYFSANDGSSGVEVWKTNGNTVTLVADAVPGPDSFFPGHFMAIGDTVFFQAEDESSGTELWRTNGNVVTRVADIAPGLAESNPGNFLALGNSLFFTADDDVSGVELWKTDGNTTTQIADINPGSGPSSPRYLTAVGNTLFFLAGDGSSGRELWKANGNTVTQVADINPGPGGSIPRYLTTIGNTLFFRADDGSSGMELWKIVGNTLTLVANINPEKQGQTGSFPTGLTAVGDTLFFTADNGSNGFELLKTDGYTVTSVADINPGFASSYPRNLTAVGDTLFFTANDGTSGVELWQTDGNTVTRIADINPGSASSHPRNLTAVGDALFFTANDGASGVELWKIDGNTAIRVADINPGSASSNPQNLTAFRDTLFFAADNGTNGVELWSLDNEPKRYLCFSGGGFNTHSFLAGFFAGALDVMEKRGSQPGSALADLMTNVEGIGAISGGSWFLSHLAYSDIFNQQFDTRAERDAYNKSGYNGALKRAYGRLKDVRLSRQQRALVASIDTLGSDFGVAALRDFKMNVQMAVKLGRFLNRPVPDWRDFVQYFVHGPLGMLPELKDRSLEAPRQGWAADKDLVIATAISTGETVLHALPGTITDDRVRFKADPTVPGAMARPLGLRSIAKPGGGFTATADDPFGGLLSFHYANNKLISAPEPQTIQLPTQGGIPLSPNLSIVDATVASSSALGATAINGVVPAEPLNSSLRLLAPLATFRNGDRIEMNIPDTTPPLPVFEDQYSNSILNAEARLIDGGYVDNAPAAFMLGQIQAQDGTSDPFDMTLFFNSSNDALTGVRINGSIRLPNDLTQLFGLTTGERAAPPGTLVDGPFPSGRDQMPSPQIFNQSAWDGEVKPQWQFSRKNVDIRYFDLDVTTVANSQFGIIGGQSGRLRLFVSNNSDSFAAPLKDSDLDQYSLNYSLARRAIRDFGGGDLMLDALGVSAEGAATF